MKAFLIRTNQTCSSFMIIRQEENWWNGQGSQVVYNIVLLAFYGTQTYGNTCVFYT